MVENILKGFPAAGQVGHHPSGYLPLPHPSIGFVLRCHYMEWV